jgi:hypothetical protein
MEDNSAVVTMANSNSGYTKKCKHFLMVLNYIKEQIALGQIEARKIYGKLNTADMHTKTLRSSESFQWYTKFSATRPRNNSLHLSFLPLLCRRKHCLVSSWTRMWRANQASRRSDPCRPIPYTRTVSSDARHISFVTLLALLRTRQWMRTYMSPQSDCTAVLFLPEARYTCCPSHSAIAPFTPFTFYTVCDGVVYYPLAHRY